MGGGGVNYFYLKERWPRCGRDAGALEGSNGSVSQLSPPPLVSGWIYGQRAETESDGEFGMEGGLRGECVEEWGGAGDKSGLLRYRRRRRCRSPRRVGDILEPSIVYTDRKHLGSKAE